MAKQSEKPMDQSESMSFYLVAYCFGPLLMCLGTLMPLSSSEGFTSIVDTLCGHSTPLFQYSDITHQFRDLIYEHFNPGVQSVLEFNQSFYPNDQGLYNLTTFCKSLKQQGHHVLKKLSSSISAWTKAKRLDHVGSGEDLSVAKEYGLFRLTKQSGRNKIGTYTGYKHVFDMLLLCIDVQFYNYLDEVQKQASRDGLSTLCSNASLSGAMYEEMEIKRAMESTENKRRRERCLEEDQEKMTTSTKQMTVKKSKKRRRS